jgi:hypothetical protein
MANETKGAPASTAPHRGIRIFTYPKTIFLWPTFVAAVIAAIIMVVSGNRTHDPRKVAEGKPPVEVKTQAQPASSDGTTTTTLTDEQGQPVRRFTSPQNLAGLLFTTVFFLNLIIMSIDFPRFTIIAVILGAAALLFLALYINVFYNILPPLVNLLEHLFVVANAQFYLVIATAILINLAVIWVTRYLDYWVILPNEILHNHGPFSDLERFPTTNLKFDKEIPDILEFALLGSGRLVLHIGGNPKAFVLDNVLWIDSKEAELKKIMGRMEVRVTTDQEAGQDTT